MITFSLDGSTDNTQKFLQNAQSGNFYSGVEGIAQRGLAALQAATPVASGLTASSWGVEVVNDGASLTITWFNTHVESGVNIAVILQYGHGTGSGGYVAGRDYINPAIQPIFDEIANDVWKKVITG